VTTGNVTLYEKEDHASLSTPRILMKIENGLLGLETSKAVSEECSDIRGIVTDPRFLK